MATLRKLITARLYVTDINLNELICKIIQH